MVALMECRWIPLLAAAAVGCGHVANADAMHMPPAPSPSTLVDHPIASTLPPLYLDSCSWTAANIGGPQANQPPIDACVPGDILTDLQRAVRWRWLGCDTPSSHGLNSTAYNAIMSLNAPRSGFCVAPSDASKTRTGTLPGARPTSSPRGTTERGLTRRALLPQPRTVRSAHTSSFLTVFGWAR
eukprot:SAG11_NODE_12363_length_707_cov_0.810855_2_plen_184_part_00